MNSETNITQKIIVKLSFPFPEWPLARQTKENSLVWGDYHFYMNDDSIEFPDYWVVFEGVLNEEKANISRDKIVFITGEPRSIKKYDRRFLNQFGHIITSQKEIKHKNKHYLQQGQPWFVGKSLDELVAQTEVPKNKKISMVASNKQQTEGHKKRLDFCQNLKDYFGDQIDWYGRGIRDFEDKWETLAPYQYSITIENDFIDDLFTEKIADCFLAHTVPLYFGCSNLDRYFTKDSFVRIDIDNLGGTIKIIENILQDKNYYATVLKDVLQSKKSYLENHQLFPLMVNFLKSIELTKNGKKESTILPEKSWIENKTFFSRVIDKLLV